MKIKRINEDKIQVIITNQDLEERNVKKWELMPSSPKAQELFQDLLDMAYEECGFEVEDDAQLMVEAYPLSVDSFVVVVTKVRPQFQDSLNIFQQEESEGEAKEERDRYQVWSFPDLEVAGQACARVSPEYVEHSALYRYQDVYYLALELLPEFQVETGALLGEYGEWVGVDEEFLKEHGVTLISRAAVTNLASIIK